MKETQARVFALDKVQSIGHLLKEITPYCIKGKGYVLIPDGQELTSELLMEMAIIIDEEKIAESNNDLTA